MTRHSLRCVAIVALFVLPQDVVLGDELKYEIELKQISSPRGKKKGDFRILIWHVDLRDQSTRTYVSAPYRVGKRLTAREVPRMGRFRSTDPRKLMVFVALLKDDKSWMQLKAPSQRYLDAYRGQVDYEMANYVRYLVSRRWLSLGNRNALHNHLRATVKKAYGKALIDLDFLNPDDVQQGTKTHVMYAGRKNEYHVHLLTRLYPHWNRSRWMSSNGEFSFVDLDGKFWRKEYPGQARVQSYWSYEVNEHQIRLESLDGREFVVLDYQRCSTCAMQGPWKYVQGGWLQRNRWTHRKGDLQIDFVKRTSGEKGSQWFELRNGELATRYVQFDWTKEQVILYDSQRRIYVYLSEGEAKVSAQPFDNKAEVLFEGHWLQRSRWLGGKEGLQVEFRARARQGTQARRWVEFQNGKQVYSFRQLHAGATHVVLYDQSRKIYVFLDASGAKVAFNLVYESAPTSYKGSWVE